MPHGFENFGDASIRSSGCWHGGTIRFFAKCAIIIFKHGILAIRR
jgi:hypothetical protein